MDRCYYGFGIILMMIIIILTITILSYSITKTVPHITPATESGSITFQINSSDVKIIHRTWHTYEINQHMYNDAYLSWIKMNPDYTMVWNTIEDCEIFMKQFPEAYQAWKKVIPLAYKSDLWRACKLYYEGGVYADAYCKPYVSINQMINKVNVPLYMALETGWDEHGMHNGFIISQPKHPFYKQYIKDMIANINFCVENGFQSMTGPVCFKKSILKVLGKNYKFKLGLNDNFYLWEFNTNKIYDNHKLILDKKYDILDSYIYRKFYLTYKGGPHHYEQCYKTGKLCLE